MKVQGIEKAKEEGLSLISTLKADLLTLEVTDDESYLLADQFLGRIRNARKAWSDRLEKIIRPIRQGLDALYALNRDVDKPLDTLETKVKRLMADHKAEERRRIVAAEEEKQRAAAELRRKAQETQAKADAATSRPMQTRLAATAQVLEETAAEIEAEEGPAPVLGTSSSSRTVKVCRVADLKAFCAAIGDGTLNTDLIEVKQAVLNRYFKEDPEGMQAWPGVWVGEDTQIVGR